MPWIILLIAGAIHAQTFSGSVLPASLLAPLQLLTLAVLFIFLFRSKTLKKAALYSFIFSLAHFCSGIYWLFISMNTYGNLAAPLAIIAVILLSSYLSLYPMLAGIIFRLFKPSTSLWGALLLAVLWGAGEWLRSLVMTGFPWLNIAYAHVDGPLSGWAPIWGSYGVALLAAFCAALISVFLLSLATKQRQWTSLITLFAVVAIGQGLKTITWSQPIHDPITVRLVQGNIDQRDKFNPATMLSSMQENFELADLPPSDPNKKHQIVIFPETIIPGFQHQLAPEFWQHIIASAANDEASYFIGTPYFEQDFKGERFIGNSIIAIDGSTPVEALYQANGVPRYDKQHLVPFGEYIPYGFRWFVEAIGIPMGDFSRGAQRQANFQVGQHVFAPNICYEDIFGDELLPSLFPADIQTANGIVHSPGATILFNVSNLAWFGNSSALGQHLQMAKMRAIETARPMLRATNTGATAHIDAKGHVISSLPYLSAGVLDVDVQGMTGFTPYAHIKNYGFLAFVVLMLLLFVVKKPHSTLRKSP